MGRASVARDFNPGRCGGEGARSPTVCPRGHAVHTTVPSRGRRRPEIPRLSYRRGSGIPLAMDPWRTKASPINPRQRHHRRDSRRLGPRVCLRIRSRPVGHGHRPTAGPRSVRPAAPPDRSASESSPLHDGAPGSGAGWRFAPSNRPTAQGPGQYALAWPTIRLPLGVCGVKRWPALCPRASSDLAGP